MSGSITQTFIPVSITLMKQDKLYIKHTLSAKETILQSVYWFVQLQVYTWLVKKYYRVCDLLHLVLYTLIMTMMVTIMSLQINFLHIFITVSLVLSII